MIGKTSNSKVRPTAMGLVWQSSVYGSAIPLIYGRTRGSLSLIWAGNFAEHTGDSGKKGKSGGKKGEPQATTYTESVDYLIGCNPIVSPLQFWANQTDAYLLTIGPTFNVSAVKTAGDSQEIDLSGTTDFYTVLGVTIEQPYDVTVNDYGSAGEVNLAGTFEMPLWNYATAGPDCVSEHGYRMWPFVFYWMPGTALVKIPAIELGLIEGTVRVYYAKLVNSLVPCSQLRLEFEYQLGEGSEWGALIAQQKLYPPYAGLGSPNLDLGSGTALPNIRAEILGSYPVYWTGDCDFADIIEDIFKSGLSQGAYGVAPAYMVLQRGLGCYEFPGTVQKIVRSSADPTDVPIVTIPFGRPNFGGNALVVCLSVGSGSVTGASATCCSLNSAGVAGTGRQLYYAEDIAETLDGTVTTTMTGSDAEVQVFEIGGVHEYNNAKVITESSGETGVTSITASILTTNPLGLPAYILSWLFIKGTTVAMDMVPGPLLKPLVVPSETGMQRSDYFITRTPGLYSFTYTYQGELSAIPASDEWTWVLIAFAATTGANYSKPLGDILDLTTLEQCRQQCRSVGLWGSLCMDSQKKASDWLQDLYDCMHAVPVWSGFKLKSIPRSEVSAVGNGGVYIAPTSAGPIADLQEKDFIAGEDSPVITVERKSRTDSWNLMSIQCPGRDSQYDDILVTAPERTAITTYGIRRDSPKMLRALQSPELAADLLGAMVRREFYMRNTYSFKLKANWKLLEPMDLVTITDQIGGLDHVPVRLLSIDEDENFALQCTAEPYIYGTNALVPVSINVHEPYSPDWSETPASINPPIFFQPPSGLDTDALWAVISNADPIYGGCLVYVSIDDGASYEALSYYVWGRAKMGITTLEWPDSTDPDTTNSLYVDLTESVGVLSNHTPQQRDLFTAPYYIGDGGNTYEIITFGDVQELSPYNFKIWATGAGNLIHRGVFSTPHALRVINSRFCSLWTAGIFKADMKPQWVGVELYFKFAAVNLAGKGMQALDDCTAYTFTPS